MDARMITAEWLCGKADDFWDAKDPPQFWLAEADDLLTLLRGEEPSAWLVIAITKQSFHAFATIDREIAEMWKKKGGNVKPLYLSGPLVDDDPA